MPNIGLFDMDGSLCDYENQLHKDVSKLFPIPEDKSVWEMEDEDPAIAHAIKLIRKQPGWWRNLPVLDDGMKIFNLAKDLGFCNNILTKGPRSNPNAWKEKVEWCDDHFGDIDIHITSNKGLVYGKFLYDDFPEYMLKWLKHRPRGLGIMPLNKMNKDFYHPQVIKWDGNNYEVIKTALVKCIGRKSNESLVLS